MKIWLFLRPILVGVRTKAAADESPADESHADKSPEGQEPRGTNAPADESPADFSFLFLNDVLSFLSRFN